MVLTNETLRNGESLAEDSVALVVPASANTPQLLRFMLQLEKILHDNHGSIGNIVPSLDWGTVITTRLHPNKFSNLVVNLSNIPEVEKVEEEPLAGAGFPKKFGYLPKSSISPSKRMRVTLAN